MPWRQWFEWMPLRWRAEQEIARRFMPGARTGITADGEAVIVGRYPLADQYGHMRDAFTIRIVYPVDFLPLYPTVQNPWCFPAHPEVFLDSHRDVWVQSFDAHIYLHWRLCLYVPGESGIDITRPDSLERVFESLWTFLTKQRIFQRDLRRQAGGGPVAKWPGPDRDHAEVGYWQAVQARGGVADDEQCVCGKPLPYGLCCRAAVDAYSDQLHQATRRKAG